MHGGIVVMQKLEQPKYQKAILCDVNKVNCDTKRRNTDPRFTHECETSTLELMVSSSEERKLRKIIFNGQPPIYVGDTVRVYVDTSEWVRPGSYVDRSLKEEEKAFMIEKLQVLVHKGRDGLIDEAPTMKVLATYINSTNS